MNDNKDPVEWAERVIETAPNGHPLRSELVPIDKADESCRNRCGHIGIRVKKTWLYDFIECAVCGKGLGIS
jgi:hypothetical protein